MNALASSIAANEADFDLVHADLLRFFPELVRNLGGDPDAIMCRAGIEPILAFNERRCLTYRAWITLMERAAAELRCLDFGMRLARLQGGGQLGPMSMVMKTCKTFGDALEYVTHHWHAHSLAAAIRPVAPRATAAYSSATKFSSTACRIIARRSNR